MDGFKLPKGRGGVSILWPLHWSNRIKKLSDGNERVIAITISASTNICLINAYMPTNGTDSHTEYSECLDIIFDIIDRYQNSHKIILVGDLNATLQEYRSNKQDKLLKKFVSEMKLTTGKEMPEEHTFFHHAGNSSSQIDYILVQDLDIMADYVIEEKSYANTSAHTAVKVVTTVYMPNKWKVKHKKNSKI